MEGNALIEMLIEASGLPSSWAQSKLKRLIEKRGLSAEKIGLNEVRDLLAELLQDVLVETKNELGSPQDPQIKRARQSL